MKPVLFPVVAGGLLLYSVGPADLLGEEPKTRPSENASSTSVVRTSSAVLSKNDAANTRGKPSLRSTPARPLSQAKAPKRKFGAIRRTPVRNRQSVPTPGRYKEIQQALRDKGYLVPAQVTGSWDQHSVDALKRLQADQNLKTTGKISSLSLIALGLGPKREGASAERLNEATEADHE